MESTMTCALTLNQWINIALTAVIVVAVSAQAWFTRTQARLLKESEQRARDRDKPTVRIVPLNHDVDWLDPAGQLTTTSFQGFSVTNAGFVDVEIISFSFELGRLPTSGDDDSPTAEIVFPSVKSHQQATISTMSLPHRLRHGESFKVLYDMTQLVEESTKIGGEASVHMRPFCQDSLGNKHIPEHWVVYRENSISFEDGPSPGRISDEDWRKLNRIKRQRYSRWSRSYIDPRPN